MKRLLWIWVLLYLGCGRGENRQLAGEPQPAAEEEAALRNLLTIHIEGVKLKVEVAQDEETRMHGLMYRDKLSEDEGMLFVFPEQRILSFWMRNTFIPLDIAFIDADGRIVDIQRMQPIDESKLYVSAAPALYALEVNAGWFERHGLKVGSLVRF